MPSLEPGKVIILPVPAPKFGLVCGGVDGLENPGIIGPLQSILIDPGGIGAIAPLISPGPAETIAGIKIKMAKKITTL